MKRALPWCFGTATNGSLVSFTRIQIVHRAMAAMVLLVGGNTLVDAHINQKYLLPVFGPIVSELRSFQERFIVRKHLFAMSDVIFMNLLVAQAFRRLPVTAELHTGAGAISAKQLQGAECCRINGHFQ